MQDSDLYDMMTDMGDSRVRERFYRLRDSGRVTHTGPGARLLATAGGKVLAALNLYIEHTKEVKNSVRMARVGDLLQEVGPERAIAIGLKVVLDTLASTESGFQRRTVGSLRNFIGKAIKKEADFLHLQEQNPELFSYLLSRSERMTEIERDQAKRRLQDSVTSKECGWDRQDISLIGAVILDFCVRFSGLIETEVVWRAPSNSKKERQYSLVKITDEVNDWILEGINFLAAGSPMNLPITQPPLDWGPYQIGGYPGRHWAPLDLMTTKDSFQYRRFAAQAEECPVVFKGLNTLQRTAWRINRRTFEVFCIAVRNHWSDVGFVGKCPDQPSKPEHDWVRGDPAWLDYKYKNREYKVLQERYLAEMLAASRTVSIGTLYEGLERWYYPHMIDFRGRCYPIGCPISYQGPDWQRGCVEFADGKPIGTEEALSWFMIHGANCYGVDKVSFVDRIRWVQDNSNRILESAKDPIEYRWWTEADKPFQFLAWCFEFRDCMDAKDPLEYVSHIPVSVDGSNNGLQIYSLVMRDAQGCLATNAMPTDVPQDAYQQVADKLTARLKDLSTDVGTQKGRWAKRILEFLGMQGLDTFPRSAVKRAVMTQPYGATMYSCQRYMVEWYHDYVRGKHLTGAQRPFPERDVYKIWYWVGSVVWDIIGDVLFSARAAMDWIRDASNIMATHRKHFEWTTPLGMKCIQHYKKGSVKTINLKSAGLVKIKLWQPNEDVDGVKAANGSCPNWIHSLDASAMFLTVVRASEAGATHFQMIHDSFGTHVCDVPNLSRILREAYIEILQGNPLGDLRDQLQSKLPAGVELPPIPERGTVDLNDLRKAQYFFA